MRKTLKVVQNPVFFPVADPQEPCREVQHSQGLVALLQGQCNGDGQSVAGVWPWGSGNAAVVAKFSYI